MLRIFFDIAYNMRALVAVIAIATIVVVHAANDFDDIDWTKVKSGHVKEGEPLPPLFNQVNTRIVGGKPARPHQLPYQVGIMFRVPRGYTWCGGSLISDRFVLTASHCVDGVYEGMVFLGAHDIENSYEQGQVRMRVSVSNFIMHAGYNSDTLHNDIALIRLPKAAPINYQIKLIALPKKDIGTENQSVVASGWGLTQDNGDTARHLRYVNLKIISNSRCAVYFRSLIRATNICADASTGKSTCQGDSGGPIVAEVDGVPTIIGLTSFGSSAGCQSGYPSVYTRVSSYLDWIQKHSGVNL